VKKLTIRSASCTGQVRKTTASEVSTLMRLLSSHKLDYVPSIEEINEAILDAAAKNLRVSLGDSITGKQEGEAA
jgi:hypothetical protein